MGLSISFVRAKVIGSIVLDWLFFVLYVARSGDRLFWRSARVGITSEWRRMCECHPTQTTENEQTLVARLAKIESTETLRWITIHTTKAAVLSRPGQARLVVS